MTVRPGSACSVMESVMDADYCVIWWQNLRRSGSTISRWCMSSRALFGKTNAASRLIKKRKDTPYEPLEALLSGARPSRFFGTDSV